MTASDGGAQAVLDSVIEVGQSSRRTLGAAEIERFISSQPGVSGPVVISNVRGNAKVGASSGIVIFTAAYDDGQQRREQELVLRHAPGSDTRLFFEYDLARQFRVQQALQTSGLPVPNPLWLDEAGEHLGISGYIMTAHPGVAPNPSAFAVGPLAEASPQDREVMLDAVMDALVKVHGFDYRAAGLSDFAMKADGDTAMQKCVNWYWRTWEWIDLPESARLAPVRRWLLDNAPSGGETLTHGNSTLHNYMFVGNQLTGMLDWEMSCIGRPESDIALQVIGNELFAAPADSGLPQPPSPSEWIARYERAGGRKLDDLDYYRRLTGFMVVIAILSVQRNMPEEVRASQRPFTDRLWAMVEA